MALENLTSGFGYTKKSVCEYIATLNQDFSKRLVDKDSQHLVTIQSLEAKVAALTAENEILRSKEQAISSAILDVQTYAQQLRERADNENERVLEDYRRQKLAEVDRLENLRTQVQTLRNQLRAMLSDMDAEAAAYEAAMGSAKKEEAHEESEAQ